MRNFIPRRDPRTLFYFMSSIFFIAVAAVLVKSDKINYDDYYFNTTEGDIYKLSLISEVSDFSTYLNCTLTELVNPFRDAVIKKINTDFCSSQRISSIFYNYTVVKNFVRFNVRKESQICPKRIDDDSPTGEYGYLSMLSLNNASRADSAFEECVLKVWESALNPRPPFWAIPLLILGFCLACCCAASPVICLFRDEIKNRIVQWIKILIIKIDFTVIKADTQINEISDQPLINSVENKRYDGINDGGNDDTEDDNDSNNASAARTLIS